MLGSPFESNCVNTAGRKAILQETMGLIKVIGLANIQRLLAEILFDEPTQDS